MNTWRHELKYLCYESELRILEKSLQLILHRDIHASVNGVYTVSSVYFDSLSRECYYDNENGTDPRYKFRMRTYNHSEDRVALEKKIKWRSKTSKKYCLIDPMICREVLEGAELTNHVGQGKALDDWIIERNAKILKPTVLIEYVRTPYVYKLGNVRITFDRFISASRNVNGLFSSEVSKIAVLPTGRHILEVKYDDYLPDPIYNILDTGHMQQITFSKYYLGCKALEGNLHNEF